MENFNTEKQIFTNRWFETTAKGIWAELLPKLKPTKIIEIGSYEGQSISYLIKTLSSEVDNLEIHCIDDWEGEQPVYKKLNLKMNLVEERFKKNMELLLATRKNINLKAHKSKSIKALSNLIAEGKSNYFDFIYIDGSHYACDVISDSVLAYDLLRVGGVIGFDDYTWVDQSTNDVLARPKIAIDAFANIFSYKTRIINTGNQQLYLQRTN
tara:strand:- start:141 stop:773 length:633 start_codon:yes stop_codon:yes gene_type:complete